MTTRGKLTEAQRRILKKMARGAEMYFSQDGDDAWIESTSGHTQFLDSDAVILLRDRGFIATAAEDDERDGRSGPPTVITPAGRAALNEVRK